MASPFQTFVNFVQGQDTGGFSSNPPMTYTESSHGIMIRTDRGVKIGRIQSWSPVLARQLDKEYEVQANATGEPVDLVPQNQTTNQISVERYELYQTAMGEAFGVPISPSLSSGTDLYTLVLQTRPFNIREVHRDPFGGIRAYSYIGCWFTNIGITIAANDDRIIKARGTIEFMRKRRLA